VAHPDRNLVVVLSGRYKAFDMLTVDDSDFTPDHIEFLHEWADNLGISVEVLVARIVLACSEGDQYVEKAPCLRPTPRE